MIQFPLLHFLHAMKYIISSDAIKIPPFLPTFFSYYVDFVPYFPEISSPSLTSFYYFPHSS